MDNYNMFDVRDKVIVITGGSGVLCGAMAKALAKQGAKVTIIARNEERVQTAAKACGDKAMGISANVLDRAQMESAAQAVMDRHGRVDILINGAGGNAPKATTGPDLTFFDLPQDAIESVVNLNLMGTIIPAQVFGKIMAEQKSGNIINISSMAAYRPMTRVVAYAASKAAISNFTQWLAVHMASEYSTAIRVNAVAPGFFLTEQNRFLLTNKSTGALTPRGQTIIDHTPMGEFGKPEDLEGVIVWLCSDAARFVHGAVIPVDGGFSAFSGV